MRPNILFLMSDQQRCDALSCHGGWIQTPVLDALASEGADLRRHFSQAPVCVPSRSSLFTGRYPHAHRVLENDARLAPHEVHVFKALKQAGYHVTYSGKNHLLPKDEAEANFDGFDEYWSESDASPERKAYRELERQSLARLSSIGSYASAATHDFPDEVTTTGRIAQQGVARLAAAPVDRPWCVAVSFSDPHVPHLAPRRHADKYATRSLPLPTWDESELDGKHPRVRVKRAAQNAAAASTEDKRRYLAIYGAMCSFVDEKIGMILGELRRRPDAGRTIIVFTSDHGDFCWHHGLCKKDLLLYDDLLHVPAIVHCPERIRPQVIDATLSEHVDLVPTLLELADVPIPFGCQGKSLGPLLSGETAQHRDEVFAEVCYPWMRSVHRSYDDLQAARARAGDTSASYNVPGDYTKSLRTKRWKYIWYGDGFEELYDLAKDPEERNSVADVPEHNTVRRELRERLLLWLALSADPRSPRTEREQRAEYDRWQA